MVPPTRPTPGTKPATEIRSRALTCVHTRRAPARRSLDIRLTDREEPPLLASANVSRPMARARRREPG
eukprot:1088294-Prymnesium_polylepis.1